MRDDRSFPFDIKKKRVRFYYYCHYYFIVIISSRREFVKTDDPPRNFRNEKRKSVQFVGAHCAIIGSIATLESQSRGAAGERETRREAGKMKGNSDRVARSEESTRYKIPGFVDYALYRRNVIAYAITASSNSFKPLP